MRSFKAVANANRITSTSHELLRRVPLFLKCFSCSSMKFVTLPLWAIATPNGKVKWKGCASSLLPRPTVG